MLYLVDAVASPAQTGTVSSDGCKQALQRYAMCVYSRWVHLGRREDHKAFQCFPDGLYFAVTRVRLENYKLFFETTELMSLPG